MVIIKIAMAKQSFQYCTGEDSDLSTFPRPFAISLPMRVRVPIEMFCYFFFLSFFLSTNIIAPKKKCIQKINYLISPRNISYFVHSQ